MIKKILLLTIVLLMSSCHIKGITNDFNKLNPIEKSKIVHLQTFENLDLNKIYIINASQITHEITKHNKVLVYIFTNGCSSKSCKPLFVYENYAKANGYQLFLVMNGFANLDKTLNQPRHSPLCAIDSEYYNTIYRGSYEKQFMNEISGISKDENRKFLGDLFIYSNGKFDKILWELP